MNRQKPLLLALVIFTVLTGGAAAQVGAFRSGSPRQFSQNSTRQFAGRTVPLEDQLRNGLRVSRPEQAVFVRLVVRAVDDGRLPQGMVNLVYTWALEKNSRIPFPYFQFAMRELASRRGVTLP